jgi:hypothetical protein
VILWEQYFGWKFARFFPMLSARFLPEITGSWQESTGKNPSNIRPEYCFHVIAISGAFLKDTVTFPHLPCGIRWPESSNWEGMFMLISLVFHDKIFKSARKRRFPEIVHERQRERKKPRKKVDTL